MPIRAREFVRKLRGGAQSHLMLADDGEYYAVKFVENPQSRRILVNEWIAHAVFRQLRIAVAEKAIIELTPEFLAAHPEVAIHMGSSKRPPTPGWHFGSRYPGAPDRLAIYDYLPDRILQGIANLHDFRAALVADRWLGNADARQAVFFRAKLREWAPSVAAHGSRVDFLAMMIDHGYAFNGPEWTFLDAAAFGLYPRFSVYDTVTSLESFEPWLQQVLYFPESVIEAARREIPPAWLTGDEDALDALLERLMRRRKDVPRLVETARAAHSKPMRNWAARA